MADYFPVYPHVRYYSRYAQGHVLQCLKSALALFPDAVFQGHNTNVYLLQLLYFQRFVPRHKRKIVKMPGRSLVGNNHYPNAVFLSEFRKDVRQWQQILGGGMRTRPSDGKSIIRFFDGIWPVIGSINSSGIHDHLRIVLSGIVCQKGIAAAHFPAPAADVFYLTVKFQTGSYAVLLRCIWQPYRIVEVVNNFFAENFGHKKIQ